MLIQSNLGHVLARHAYGSPLGGAGVGRKPMPKPGFFDTCDDPGYLR